MSNVYVGDIGLKIILDTEIDISTGTIFKIKYKKPISGSSGEWTATKESDNQSISYTTTLATDLDEDGLWVFNAYVEMPTWTGHGDSVRLNVHDVGSI